jgi:hypothetical protein
MASLIYRRFDQRLGQELVTQQASDRLERFLSLISRRQRIGSLSTCFYIFVEDNVGAWQCGMPC